jgi:hypothetical protein
LNKRVNFFFANSPLRTQVCLIANQGQPYLFVRVHPELFEPVLDISEARCFCQIKNKENSYASLVVGPGDGLKRFLAGGIPNLQLGLFVFDVEHPRPELDTESGLMLVVEATFDEPEQDTALSDI